MSYLVDASVLCEATRPKSDPKVIGWLERHDAELYVSVITFGAINKGIQLLPRSKKRSSLEKWFHELNSGFSGRLIPVDGDVMIAWAKLYAMNQKAGRSLPSFDSLLAATALHHDLAIATRNSSDFPAEVKLVNPWK